MEPEFYSDYFRLEDRHWWFVGRRRILQAVLRSRPPQAGGEGEPKILDLGCGTGAMLAHLREFGEVTGADADADAIRFCRARGEEGVHLLESTRLPFADGSVDLVTALDVLEHIEDDRRTLREIVRVLRPGGRLLATVPAYGWMWGIQDEVSHHHRRYTVNQVIQTASGSGLVVDRVSYFNTLLFPPIAAIRLIRRIRPARTTARSDFDMTDEGGGLNRALAAIFSLEGRWLTRRRLPFGVSILAEANKAGSGH